MRSGWRCMKIGWRHRWQCVRRHCSFFIEGLEPVVETHGSHAGWLTCRVIFDAVKRRVVQEVMVEVLKEKIFEMTAPVVAQGNVRGIGHDLYLVQHYAQPKFLSHAG